MIIDLRTRVLVVVGHRSGNSALQRVPIYFQLRELFIERIKTGAWSARSPLPTELQLAGEFAVSVGTVRRVMDELSDLGLVKRSRGRGTFVNDIHAVGGLNGLDPLRNHDGSRIVWDPSHVEIEVGAASLKERAALGAGDGRHDVLRMTCLLRRRKRIVAYQQSAIPLAIGIDVTRSRHVEGLAELYARSGIFVYKSEDALGFEIPCRDVSMKMNVADGAPLHRLTRRLLDDRKVVVGVSTMWLMLKDEIYTSSHRIVDI